MQTVFIWSSVLWKIKEDSYRPKYITCFYFCLKRNDSQTFKRSRCKKKFLRCVCYWHSFDKGFLFHVITGRHTFLKKCIVTLRFFSNAMLLLSLKQVIWKKSLFYFLSPEPKACYFKQDFNILIKSLIKRKQVVLFKGCVRLIFASLFFKSKREHASN